MKSFIRKISLFAVIIILGTAIGELSLRHLPNDYSYKAQWMEKNVHSVKYLIIGASDGMYGINPDYLPDQTFNLCFVSQSFNYTEFLFDKYIDDMDSIKCLILTISYPYVFGDDMSQGIESWRCKNYNIYFGDTRELWNPEFNLLLLNHHGLGIYKHIFQSWLGHDIIQITNKGFGTAYSLDKRDSNWQQEADLWVSRHSKQEKDMLNGCKDNSQRLKHIVEKCSEKGCKILLVTLPVYKDYIENLPKEQIEIHHEFCNNAVNLSDNVVFLDYTYDDDFEDDDFFDVCHLSAQGAKKISKKLDVWLKINM